MKTVITFGTFDLVHPGHKFFLQQAKTYGDRLITIIARDNNVLKFKWHLPDRPEQQRLEDIQKLNIANIVEFGHESDYFLAIQKYQPDIIALGHDQIHLIYDLGNFLFENKYKTEVVTIDAYHPETYKSSLLKKQK